MWHENAVEQPQPERPISRPVDSPKIVAEEGISMYTPPKWFKCFMIAAGMSFLFYFVFLFLKSRIYEDARSQLLRAHSVPIIGFSLSALTSSSNTCIENFFSAVEELERIVRG